MDSSGRSVVQTVVKRDAGNSCQQSQPCGEETATTPRLPPLSSRLAHTRAVVSLDGSRCIVIIDTGADVSLVSARMLRPGVKYQPWSERDGGITGIAQQGIAVLGRALLEVCLGPVRALAPFIVALGVEFDAILSVDVLYEHEISVNLAQHCLVFETHDGMTVPLVGHHRRFKHACSLTHDVALYPGVSALVRLDCDRPGRDIGLSPTPEVYPIVAQNNRELGLAVPEQLSTGLIEICCTADHPLYFPAGGRVAKVQDCSCISRGPQAAIDMLSASDTGEPSAHVWAEATGSTAAGMASGPGKTEVRQLDQSGAQESDRVTNGELQGGAQSDKGDQFEERTRSPDKDPDRGTPGPCPQTQTELRPRPQRS